MRISRWVGAVVAGAAIMTATATSPTAEAGTPAREDSVAARAVSALTADDADPLGAVGAVPDDFAALFGYRPTVIGGMLANPDGDCSSPVPLPVEFDTACKAHDLGYDLLRYARLTDTDLGPWARTALDDQLDRRMHDACDARVRDRAACFALANTATAAVGMNSLRQGYGVPVDEPWIRYTAGSALVAAGLLIAMIAVRRVRPGISA